MRFSLSIMKKSIIKSIIIILFAILVTITLGFMLHYINDMDSIENMLETNKPSMPSILLDRNGLVITEFFSDEKRDVVSLDTVPDYLIRALILWEDESFFHHHGINPFAIMRAAFNNAIGRPVSGASTLTQQLSRTLFLSNEFSLKRKIRELLIAFQLEKKYTKNEILSLYLNNVPFGYGINGVQAASKFFFGKEVSDITYAEAASLITVISNPTFYSLSRFPQNHRTKQQKVLNKIVRAHIISKEESDSSFQTFWQNWEVESLSAQGAFYNRQDKAPFFSSWILQILEKELPSVNVYRDGLTIKSTLDLNGNQYVETMLKVALEKQQAIFDAEQKRNFNIVQNMYLDAIALMSQTANLSNVNIGRDSIINRGIAQYQNNINPGLNLTLKMLGIHDADRKTENAFVLQEASAHKHEDVQGAFLAIDNETGEIVAMVGGKHFDVNNRFNFAMQGRRQAGSAFKPFVYSAALDTGTFNAATIINDEPTDFTFGSDDPEDWYRPSNYGGVYYGKVSVRKAIRRSLNIPAVKVFYEIGKENSYKVPIDRAALLLGLNAQSSIDARFAKQVSTVLGTSSVSLSEMVQAYSVFANLGQKRVMSSILQVEDRDGKIIWNPSAEMGKYHKDNTKRLQIITPQNAFIMTDIMKGTVHMPDGFLFGTKRRIIESGKTFPNVELAAKSGTTQNWSDGWILGYSPKITAGAWMGFKKYGLSLGYNQDGSIILGEIWVDYMRHVHLGQEKIHFKEPKGLYHIQICAESGKLPSESCKKESLYYELFLPGFTPTETCAICSQVDEQKRSSLKSFNQDMFLFDDDALLENSSLTIDKSLLMDDLFEDSMIANFADNEDTFKVFDERPTDSMEDYSDIIKEQAKEAEATSGIDKENLQEVFKNLEVIHKDETTD